MKRSRKLEFKTAELVTILLAICIFSTLTGCLVGYRLLSTKTLEPTYTEVDEDLQSFINEYNEIKNNYYGVFDSKKALTNAITAVLESLGDNYSGVVDLESSSSDAVKLEGVYTGVGIEIYNDEKANIVVNSVFKGTPAHNAGLKTGDIIVKFNGISVEGLSTTELVTKIKGTEGRTFTLEVYRDGARFNVSLKSETIVLKSVETAIYKSGNDDIGYIRVSIFANNTASQFKEALNKLDKNNINGLILDFRNNPGGYLHAANDIADLLLDSSMVVYKTESNGMVEGYYSTGNKNYDKKIVILINNNSASASELITASLKENLNALVVGETSYGKGTVQEVKKYNGTQYKYTTKLWLTPSGKSINGVGIVPHFIVVPNGNNDNQLQKALEQFK